MTAIKNELDPGGTAAPAVIAAGEIRGPEPSFKKRKKKNQQLSNLTQMIGKKNWRT